MKKPQDDYPIKDPVFRIPEGYFENLSENLQARIAATVSDSSSPVRPAESERSIPLRSRRLYRWTAAAAAIALLLGIGLALRTDGPRGEVSLASDEQSLRNYLLALEQPADRTTAFSENESWASYLLDAPQDEQQPLIYWEQNDNLYALESAVIEQYICDHYNILELAAL